LEFHEVSEVKEGNRCIRVTIRIEPSDRQYASYCDELDVASCGDTLEEAFENIKDAIAVTLNGWERRGVRAKKFREKGIRMRTYRKSPRPVQQAVKVNSFVTVQQIPVPVVA